MSHRADRTHDRRHRELAAEIAGYLGGSRAAIPGTGPVITLEIDVDGARLRFFSTSATLSTATDAALEGLHLCSVGCRSGRSGIGRPGVGRGSEQVGAPPFRYSEHDPISTRFQVKAATF